LNVRLITRILLASLFLFAGALHLLSPATFLPLMPPFIPFPYFSVIASGVFELLGSVGLLIPEPRLLIFTGWSLVLLLIAVFPANIYMAIAKVQIHGIPSEPWMAWARLPLQPLLMLAVLWATGVWPKTKAASL
jgi:uncharacterized membrane protein